MLNYQVVQITENHVEGYRDAIDSVARERKYLAFLEGPPLEMSRAFVLENIQGNWSQYVAISEGRVIGWCGVSSLRRPIFVHSGGLGMGVLSDYRGQGVGTTLMRAVLDRAKFIGLTRVELTVRENNKAAITLYEKFGFVVEGYHRNAGRIDGKYENHISMALLFE